MARTSLSFFALPVMKLRCVGAIFDVVYEDDVAIEVEVDFDGWKVFFGVL